MQTNPFSRKIHVQKHPGNCLPSEPSTTSLFLLHYHQTSNKCKQTHLAERYMCKTIQATVFLLNHLHHDLYHITPSLQYYHHHHPSWFNWFNQPVDTARTFVWCDADIIVVDVALGDSNLKVIGSQKNGSAFCAMVGSSRAGEVGDRRRLYG